MPVVNVFATERLESAGVGRQARCTALLLLLRANSLIAVGGETVVLQVADREILDSVLIRLLKFTQPSTPAEQREKMTASPDEQ